MAASLPPDFQQLQALVFDVDGTLYEQMPVRLAMLWRVMHAHRGSPTEGLMTLKALRAYRAAQERLRSLSCTCSDLAEEQLALASRQTGVPVRRLREYVQRWMEVEPLDLLGRYRRSGIVDLLKAARNRGLELAVFSDYPADAKLRALGLHTFFDVVITAQDSDVQRFKPDPRGLEIALDRLGVDRSRAAYIGDRPSVDGEAARRAGLPCFIVGHRCRSDAWVRPTTCVDLTRMLMQAV